MRIAGEKIPEITALAENTIRVKARFSFRLGV